MTPGWRGCTCGDLLQDAGTLQLLGVRQIVAIRSDLQPVRIENGRFGIVRITRVELLQRLLVCGCARLERNRRVIFEDCLDGCDVVAFTRRLAAELLRLLDRGPAFLLQFRRRWRTERIVETRDRLGPIRHRAGRIRLQHGSDGRIDPFPVEGVQERSHGVEPRLCLQRCTRRGSSPLQGHCRPRVDGRAPVQRRAA